MGMDPFIGEIQMAAFTFAPKGFALCDGSLLPIPQNEALFSLIGTIYGGDGVTNFALPDLRGRGPLGAGTGSRLSDVVMGQQGGAEAVQLMQGQLPAHSHTATAAPDAHARPRCASGGGSLTSPAGSIPAAVVEPSTGALAAFALPAQANQDMAPLPLSLDIAIGTTGDGAPVDVRSPFLGINFIIALEGVYPTRG